MRSSEGGAGAVTGSGAWRRARRELRPRDEAGPGGRWGEQGAVTAEAAMAIPVMVIFALALLWALMAASAQIRCVDAARAGARAAARSEPEAQVREAALSAAPERARIEVERAGELWRVTVAAPAPGPGPLAVTLSAEAVAAAEDVVGAAGSAAEEGGKAAADTVGAAGSAAEDVVGAAGSAAEDVVRAAGSAAEEGGKAAADTVGAGRGAAAEDLAGVAP